MPPLFTEEESALDPYAILGLASTAAEQEIKKAYRKMSLKYHPDKNSTPEGAVMFRKIAVSLEILSDSAKRNYLDTRLESDRRKKEKYAEMDKKRKEMVDALNAREESAKKAKVEQVQRKKAEAEEENIKEAGRRMLEEAQKRAAAAAAATSKPPQSNGHQNGHSRQNGSSTQPAITPIDLTLVLSLPSSSAETSTSLRSRLSMKYGSIEHAILKDPPAANEEKKKKPKKDKGRKAMVEFEKGNWGGCWACWKDHQNEGVEGVKAKWAGGEEPAWVAWAARQDIERRSTTTNGNGAAQNGSNGSFGSAPDFGGTSMEDLLAEHDGRKEQARRKKAEEEEFESMTLLRMRQLERQRMEEQIRRQEEED